MKYLETDKNGVIFIDMQDGRRLGVKGPLAIYVDGEFFHDHCAITYIELSEGDEAEQDFETGETSFEFECGKSLVFSGGEVEVRS